MDTKRFTRSPSTRLKTGAAILAGARVIDTKPVKDRLAAFAEVHRTYVKAHRKVDAAEAQLHDTQAQLAHVDLDQDDAVEALALALANDHQPRGNPFGSFGADSPGAIKSLPFGEEAQAIHTLVAAVQRSKTLSPATLDAAKRAEAAAVQMEKALAPLETLRANVVEARHKRDVIAQRWDGVVAALRRRARSAADDGAPGLYAALFHPPVRPTKKAKADSQATATPAAPTQAAQPAQPAA